MGIYRLPNVPLLPQPTDAVCWYMCMRMLAEWKIKTRGSLGEMIDVQDHAECQRMYKGNVTWPADNNSLLARWLRMTKYAKESIPMDYKSVSDVLAKKGPIWAGGVKTWGTAAHGHVVVICGVADTGVLVHDPEPLRTGLRDWKTWDSIKEYVGRTTDRDGNTVSIDFNFMTCP